MVLITKSNWWGWSTNDKWYFINSTALTTAYPVWQAGRFAEVWNDAWSATIWLWDNESSIWVNSGITPTTDHSLLSNLDFASSGHTWFEPERAGHPMLIRDWTVAFSVFYAINNIATLNYATFVFLQWTWHIIDAGNYINVKYLYLIWHPNVSQIHINTAWLIMDWLPQLEKNIYLEFDWMTDYVLNTWTEMILWKIWEMCEVYSPANHSIVEVTTNDFVMYVYWRIQAELQPFAYCPAGWTIYTYHYNASNFWQKVIWSAGVTPMRSSTIRDVNALFTTQTLWLWTTSQSNEVLASQVYYDYSISWMPDTIDDVQLAIDELSKRVLVRDWTITFSDFYASNCVSAMTYPAQVILKWTYHTIDTWTYTNCEKLWFVWDLTWQDYATITISNWATFSSWLPHLLKNVHLIINNTTTRLHTTTNKKLIWFLWKNCQINWNTWTRGINMTNYGIYLIVDGCIVQGWWTFKDNSSWKNIQIDLYIWWEFDNDIFSSAVWWSTMTINIFSDWALWSDQVWFVWVETKALNTDCSASAYDNWTSWLLATNVQTAIDELQLEKQATLTFGIADTNAVKIDFASVVDNDYAKFTANGLEWRSYAEVVSDIWALTNPMSAQWDMIYGWIAWVPTRLIVGSPLQVLRVDAWWTAVERFTLWGWSWDVVWPASAVGDNITVFDGTTGKLIKDWWKKISDLENALTFSTWLTRATNTITSNLSTWISWWQSVIGWTWVSENLTLFSTSNWTKWKILLWTSAYDEVNNRLWLWITVPLATLDVVWISRLWDSSINYTTFSATGKQTMLWTARVTRDIYLNAYNLWWLAATYNGVNCAASWLASLWGMVYLKTYDDWQWAGTAEDSIGWFILPEDYENWTDVSVVITRCTWWTSGVVRRQCWLQNVSVWDSYVLTETYATPVNVTVPWVARQRIDTTFTFTGTAFEALDELNIVVFREADDAWDTYSGDAYTSCIDIRYISNKLWA